MKNKAKLKLAGVLLGAALSSTGAYAGNGSCGAGKCGGEAKKMEKKGACGTGKCGSKDEMKGNAGKKASGACVIAVLNKAKELLLFLCPVKSLKLFGYTAIEGFTFAGDKFLSSSDCKSNIALDSIFFVNAKSLFSFNTAQLESKITDRQRNCRNISILVRYS